MQPDEQTTTDKAISSFAVTSFHLLEHGLLIIIALLTIGAVAREIAGEARVIADAGREMGAEDFSYMLEKRPGAYLFIGQGDTAGLHHAAYNFDDEIAPVGASFFARISLAAALPISVSASSLGTMIYPIFSSSAAALPPRAGSSTQANINTNFFIGIFPPKTS